ncbi:hypothetical protein D3C81_406690 [compost metagenome]
MIQPGSIDACLQHSPFRAIAEHHRVQLRMALAQGDQAIEKQVRSFLLAQTSDVTGQPAFVAMAARRQGGGLRQAIGDHLQLVLGDTCLAVDALDALGHADHFVDGPGAAQLQTQPGVQALFAIARGKAMLGGDHRQAPQRRAQPAKYQPFEVVTVDQRLRISALAQLSQHLAQAGAAAAGHASGAKTRHQFLRGTEEQHQVLSRGSLAVVQQHPLGTVEATAAEQVDDRPLQGQGCVQLRTQCTSRGSDQPL